ncbi:MAG: TusE/DsrC/DsvC family sulfur relay protein [Anaerolineales bacterium]|nr:TusE/DsrC/DsvC family sulfur relay protein [Anaerolineales bacterium]
MTDQTALALLENVAFDEEGYMTDPAAWTEDIAAAIASREGLELTDRHWIVIRFAREEFNANGDAPTLRKITKTTDVDTKELYGLFPGGPAKLAAKVSGLGKPTGCI